MRFVDVVEKSHKYIYPSVRERTSSVLIRNKLTHFVLTILSPDLPRRCSAVEIESEFRPSVLILKKYSVTALVLVLQEIDVGEIRF